MLKWAALFCRDGGSILPRQKFRVAAISNSGARIGLNGLFADQDNGNDLGIAGINNITQTLIIIKSTFMAVSPCGCIIRRTSA